MKKLKVVIPCIFTLIALIASFCLAAGAEYIFSPYYIESYDVSINVLEDNTLQIKEHISAYFNQPRHGIYRNIPLKNTVQRTDGTQNTFYAKVKNLKVSEEYSDDSDLFSNECSFRIGDEDKTVTGSHAYTISYDYAIGRDTGVGYDELYYNIIGDGWDTYIQNVSFDITMPKDFDETLLGFSSGAYGSVGTDNIEYTVNGRSITGTLNKTLSPGNAFTVRLELPENYFSFNAAAYYAKLSSMIVIPILTLIAAILLWAKYGRDEKVVEVVEFYPPEGMSSADVAYWYKGSAELTDMVPLLIELANEGFLEINDIGKGRRSNTEIKLVREYNGIDRNKDLFYRGLKSCSSNGLVYTKDLKGRFNEHLAKVLGNCCSRQVRNRIFNRKSLTMRLLGWVLSIAGVAADLIILDNINAGGEKFMFFIVGALISIAAFAVSCLVRQRTPEGHRILQHITGFKLFLETAEKEKLEELVLDDPKYFYDILPYAYVLGVSDKYMEKFEDIAIPPPTWYNGCSTFDYLMFRHFIRDAINTSSSAMVYTPPSSSGSSGGGGFSGGGSGGGGGGSW